MDGLDRIIGRIADAGNAEAEKKAADAARKREKMLADAAAAAESAAAEIRAGAEREAASILAKARSGAQSEKTTAILGAKNEKISAVIARAVRELKTLDDAAYFALITELAKKYAGAGTAVIRFGEKDLRRLPDGFAQTLSDALGEGRAVTLSDEPADIDGGFILEYGKIIWNCSFDSLAEEYADAVRDAARKALFP